MMRIAHAIGVIFAVLLGLTIVLAIWGFVEAHHQLKVVRISAPLPQLGADWEGRRIAVLSDIHAGMWLGNENIAKRAVQRVLRERPSAVLLLGDFITPARGNPAQEIAAVAGLLRPIRAAGIPAVAVLGNHDYGIYSRGDPRDTGIARLVRTALVAKGIHVLNNEAVALGAPASPGKRRPGTSPLYIAGIGSAWAGEDDARGVVAEVPDSAPRIVIMHNPSSFGALPAGAAPIAIAGHTHCGQIRIPGLPRWSWLDLVRDEMHPEHWAGASYGAAGNRLFVTCGIGLGVLPIRINDPPELIILTLQRAARS